MRVLKSTQGLLATLRCRAIFLYPGTETLSEWLRRWTRNPLGSARKGLESLRCRIAGSLRGWSLEATPVALADKAEEHRSNHWCSWRLASMPVEERRALRSKPERRDCLWPTSSKGACSVGRRQARRSFFPLHWQIWGGMIQSNFLFPSQMDLLWWKKPLNHPAPDFCNVPG